MKFAVRTLCAVFLSALHLFAGFGQAPKGWEDIRFGLVSNGLPYDESQPLTWDTHRLKTATEELGIDIKYRYRYVNEGVNPAKNACVNLFQWKWGTNYSEQAQEQAGVEASYVIYVLQEEGGTAKLLSNISDAQKMQHFFHTLRIVAENAAGHGAVIVVEPDTWGYLLQDHYQTKENDDIEVDPREIPAVVNNIPDTVVRDSFYVIPDTSKPWEKQIVDSAKEISYEYLSDLPNTMAGLGRGIIRTMHRYAPDCYVGFLASHWSVNLGLDGNGWNSQGMVWASDELIDTSAKINIEFFERLYWGSIDEEHPKKPGDDPDFIGVEKNGWCAGKWKDKDGRTDWYWGDQEMKNYLGWVKQIGQGLDLPVLGWQISIGNMDNPNSFDTEHMANAWEDTFFPYFFDHVDEFIDAGFIGFLVGKGLSQGTDYTLPSEPYGEQGWFFSQLMEFDKGRPYDINFNDTATSVLKHRPHPAALEVSRAGQKLQIHTEQSLAGAVVQLYSLKGQLLREYRLDRGQKSLSLGTTVQGAAILRIHHKGRLLHRSVISRGL
ncbi:MAG: hypothetical protein ACQEQV_04265 [Fibrobacterota bacterium]